MNTPRILAIIAFRDEEKHLPGMFSHLRKYVDGFIAFDDCSTDRSAAIARAEPKMVEFFERHTPSADHFFEIQNREAMLASAHRHGADWVLCCDADERFETKFLEQMRAIARNPPAQILGLRLLAVWEHFGQHRVGNARKFIFFPSTDPLPYRRPGQLHQQWYPPGLARASKMLLDYRIYHLGSFTRKVRRERYKKFMRIDPDFKEQPRGYKNLIDESDLVLAPILPDRAFCYE